MQTISLESSRPIARQSGAESARAARPVGHEQAQESSRATHRPAAGALRRGLQTIDPQQNRRVAAAQQTLEFLGMAGAELRGIEAALTHRTAGGNEHASLEQRIQRFAELWSGRSRATGGLLDDRLQLVRDGNPRRRFTVHGLDFATLRAGSQELLSLATGVRGRTEVSSVLVEPQLPPAEIVKRFDRALAASGIRASHDPGGELRFEVAEAAWPAVRDTLAIKGEGRRFPTGQFNRVPAIPEPPVIHPQAWSVEAAGELESLLRQVRQATEHLRQAHRAVSGLLAEEGRRVVATDAQWSASFVRTFEAAAGRGDYRMLVAAAPALTGLSRERVIAVLRPF